MFRICILVSFLVLLHISSSSLAQAGESLVLCLSFDAAEGSIAKDYSTYGFHGIVDGAEWRDGRFGNALGFDGIDDYVSVPDSPELRLLNGCTLMAWINLEGQGISVWPRIFCKEEYTNSSGGFHTPIDWDAGVKVRFVIDGGGGDTSPVPLEMGKWYHTAVTCDGQDMRIYLDGDMILEVPQENPFPDASPELQIGNSPAGPRAFHGLIDEARIWSKALSKEEIQRQMDMSTQDVMFCSLSRLIDGMDIHAGVKNSLLAKVDAAWSAYKRGQLSASINMLKALLNEVESQRGKKITDGQATSLVDAVERTIDSMGFYMLAAPSLSPKRKLTDAWGSIKSGH